MCIFIGGVQPRTVKLEDRPRMCRSCGLYQARLKRVDHYISIFFIPLIPVKRGTPFLECNSCGHISTESGEVLFRPPEGEKGKKCPGCGKTLDKGFRYCPFCGRDLY